MSPKTTCWQACFRDTRTVYWRPLLFSWGAVRGGVEGGAQYFQSAASVGPQITLNFATQCVQPECAITALFTNMRILKFKSHLTIAFLAAVNHLIGPLRKLNFTLTDSKGRGLWFVIGGFRSVLCVFVFRGSLLVIVIMIDGSQKRNCEGGFWTLEFAWKAQ